VAAVQQPEKKKQRTLVYKDEKTSGLVKNHFDE
jgi:hypothetical protein